jgi:uncharacterized membrane protein YkvA (DUF1232 family)
MNLKERAKQLKSDIPHCFLSLKSKIHGDCQNICRVTIAYALSPIDLIPDFVPVLGYLDDVILLPVLIALTIKFIPRETFDRYKTEAEGMWQDGSRSDGIMQFLSS